MRRINTKLVRKISPKQGFAPLVIILIIAAILFIGFLVFFFVFNSNQPKTAEEYHQRNLQALNSATSIVKQQASKIDFIGNKIVDEGKDLGCKVGPIATFGSLLHSVFCLYRYDVVFLGSENVQKDAGELIRQIEKAGWTNQAGANAQKIFFDNSGNYNRTQWTIFSLPDSMSHSNWLHMNIVTNKNYMYNDRNPLNKSLIKEYMKSPTSYFIEYFINYSYVDTECTQCEPSNSKDYQEW